MGKQLLLVVAMFLSASEKGVLNLLALRLEHDLVELGKLMPGSLKFQTFKPIQLYAIFLPFIVLFGELCL